MSYRPTIGGKLREETSGVDRSQAVSACWGTDPVKEISQTCGLNVIMRRMATSNRSVVTAAKLVYSTWKIKPPGERDGKTIYRNRFAPQPLHLLYSFGKRADVFDGVGAGGFGKVREEAAAHRRSGSGDHGQHASAFRCGFAACGARSGGEHQSVSCDSPVGEENGPERRTDAGVVFIKEYVARGAHER